MTGRSQFISWRTACRLAFISGLHAQRMKLIDRLSRFGWSTMYVGPMFSISSIGADILLFEHEMQVVSFNDCPSDRTFTSELIQDYSSRRACYMN